MDYETTEKDTSCPSLILRVLLVPCAVFLGAGGALGLAHDRWLRAGAAYAKLFGPLAVLFLLVAAMLFALGPLISVLIVFAAFLLTLLKFAWGWSTARLLTLGSFFGFGFRVSGFGSWAAWPSWRAV